MSRARPLGEMRRAAEAAAAHGAASWLCGLGRLSQHFMEDLHPIGPHGRALAALEPAVTERYERVGPRLPTGPRPTQHAGAGPVGVGRGAGARQPAGRLGGRAHPPVLWAPGRHIIGGAAQRLAAQGLRRRRDGRAGAAVAPPLRLADRCCRRCRPLPPQSSLFQAGFHSPDH